MEILRSPGEQRVTFFITDSREAGTFTTYGIPYFTKDGRRAARARKITEVQEKGGIVFDLSYEKLEPIATRLLKKAAWMDRQKDPEQAERIRAVRDQLIDFIFNEEIAAMPDLTPEDFAEPFQSAPIDIVDRI